MCDAVYQDQKGKVGESCEGMRGVRTQGKEGGEYATNEAEAGAQAQAKAKAENQQKSQQCNAFALIARVFASPW